MFLNFPSSTSMVTKAKMAALAAHESVDQVRKYGRAAYGPERYYFHPCRVAELVKSVGCEDWVSAAAALHDVLEDVTPTYPYFDANWIYTQFGELTLGLVVECTNVFSKDAEQRRVLSDSVGLLVAIGAPTLDYMHELPALFAKADKMNRRERKLAEAERYGKISGSAKVIKRADLFDNDASLADAPASFAEAWRSEKAVAESYIGDWETYVREVRSWEERRKATPTAAS